MTEKKKVANTLKTILNNPIMQTILDRSKDITPIIEEVTGWWTYDLFSRKPGPAYLEDGTFIGTDLDLACFLYELSNRNAVINIPTYTGIRAKSKKKGQIIVSKENRHGTLLGLNANKETFIFSIKIKDANVMTTDSVGDYRNFSLTDFSGDWYDGWKKLEFLPNAKENNFITESKILTKNSITFKNFSHPNRWTSFFGQYYFMTKCLIDRLTEEAAYYNTNVKLMLEEGITFPKHSEPGNYPEKTTEKGKSIKVKAFQVEIDVPDNKSEYTTYVYNQENLVKLADLRRDYIYKIIPRLRFATRATELSYYIDQKRMPAWLEDVKWEENYVLPGKRIKWDRLVLFQPGVGQQGVAIRKRNYEKAEIVSMNYEE